MTARLESLEEAEVRARQAVEDARKEAHRIRLGIGSQIEELASRKTRNLANSRETAKEKVQEAVSRLESDLCAQVSIRLAELGNRETDLNEKAVELIRGVIMSAEEEGT